MDPIPGCWPGNLLGGWVAGALLRGGMSLSLARRLSITIFTGFMVLTIPAVFARDVCLSIAFISLAMLGYTGVTANMLAMPADVFPPGVLASIWGYAGLGSGFGGMLFALVTGWLVDHYSYVPVFIGFGLMPFVALFIIWTLLGPQHTVYAEAEAQTAT